MDDYLPTEVHAEFAQRMEDEHRRINRRLEGVEASVKEINRLEQLYRIKQTELVSVESQPPEAEGMLAVYSPIVLDHAGTLEDPIPWVHGMDCYSEKYYSYNGKVYKCAGDMIPCVWEPGSAELWQWEEVTD